MKRRPARAALAAVLLLSGPVLLEDVAAAASFSGSTLDPSFGVGGKVTVPTPGRASVRDLVSRPDGSVVGVGRLVGDDTTHDDAFVFRLRPDGRYDAGFGIRRLDLGGAFEQAEAVALQKDGKIVVAGSTSGGYDAFVWRLNPNGSTDGGFGSNGVRALSSGGQEYGHDVAIGPDGKIVVAGSTSDGGGSMVAYRVTPQGDPDGSFDSDGDARFGGTGSSAYSVVVQGDGKVVATGYDSSWMTASLYRLKTDGKPDLGYGVQGRAGLPYTSNSGYDLARTSGGRVYALSDVQNGHGDEDPAVFRVTAAGTVDRTFGGSRGATFDLGGDEYLNRIAALPTGGVVGAGETSIGSDLLVAQFTSSGRPDTSFGPHGVITRGGVPDYAEALAVQATGKIVLGGDDDRTTWRPLVARFLGTSRPVTCGGRLATIVGTGRADRLVGTARADVIVGFGGNDVVHARGGNDVVCGNAGNDVLYGESGADTLYGGAGADRLSGGAGRDRVVQ